MKGENKKMLKVEKTHFEIDVNQLAEEWVMLPQNVFSYTCNAAEARLQYEEAKRLHDVLRADTSLAIRRNPEQYGILKVTEAMVDAALELDPKVQESAKNVIDKKNELDIAVAAINALDAKKKGLECLVHLHATAYYSNPSESKYGKINIPGIKPSVITNSDEHPIGLTS
jgi:hypothetical protein